MRFRIGKIMFVVLLLVVMAVPMSAQDDSPIVQVAFFYSPTCPHCHEVIDNVLPGVQDQFGDQLQVYFIDVTNQQAAYMLYEACDVVGIPDDRCGSVPTMVIGERYLIGSGDIPAHMSEYVQEGLDGGGLDLSNLPLLWSAIQQVEALEGDGTLPTPPTWQEKFAADMLGSSTAVAVLVALVLTVVGSAFAYAQTATNKHVPQWLAGMGSHIITLLALVSAAIVLSGIIFSGGGLPNILAIVSGVLIVIAAVMMTLNFGLTTENTRQTSRMVIPLLLVAGLIVAGYLSYVETTQAEAVCGVVGDCNAVQASPYAKMFGIPIGVIGVAGYAALFVAWLLSLQTGDTLRGIGERGLFLMSLFGVIFSAYLTFLEPFVIGAVCAWCITSALLMLALAWQTAPNGLVALVNGHTDAPQTLQRAMGD